MTRENKLAMVIGLALVLLAGILIADQLSSGHERQETLQEAAQPLRVAAAPPPSPSLREIGEGAALATEASRRRPAAPPQPARSEGTTAAPVRPIDPGTISIEPRPRDPLASERPPAAAPLQERTYRVQEGDALSRIAATLYGDASLWEALATYNRDRLPNPDRLRPGLVLRVPPREVLVGGGAAPAAAPMASTDPPRQAASDRTPAPATATATARTRVVREGETLSQIAAETLGSSRRWQELVDANRDRIRDPNRVLAGTELRIPASR